MLQISTGMYFDGGEVWETTHRRVFYTNLIRVAAEDVDLPIGRLQFASAGNTLAVTAVDRLPKHHSDGSETFHVATDGETLLGDVADVVAFALDALVLDNFDLARQLIRARQDGGSSRRDPRLRRTYTPGRFVTDDELADVRQFASSLLALERPYFERAMRAIRRVVDAATMADTDVTLAYSLFVAALESLSANTEVPTPAWDDYERNRRQVVDAAVAGLPDDRVGKIRDAVLSIDQLSLRRKFQSFVLGHTEPSFYRTEATGASQPIRAVDLPRALNFAYQTRSISLHEMRDLVPELWAVAGVDDTTYVDGQWVLTVEGLNRLSRHVIRRFIARAPTGTESGFDWQRVLPGVVQVRLHPTMWLHMYDGFRASEGPHVFGTTLEMICTALGGRGQVADMATPLAQIERLLVGTAKQTARVPLIATYLLWHYTTPLEMHRPDADRIIEKHAGELGDPSIPALALGVLLKQRHPWTTRQLSDLVQTRTKELGQRRTVLELPRAMDAAFQLVLARELWADGDIAKATSAVAAAVGLDPGNESLIGMEASVLAGVMPEMDLYRYVTEGSLSPDDSAEGSEEGGRGGSSSQMCAGDDPNEGPRTCPD